MKNGGNGIRIVSYSSDFKNRAGRKTAAFFFAEDLIYFSLLLPAVLLPLRMLKAGAAAYWATLLLLAGFLLFTVCRLKPNRIWKSVLLIIPLTAALCAVFLAVKNYAAAAVIFFAMIVSFVKLKHDFLRLYDSDNTPKGHARRDFRSDQNTDPVYLDGKIIVLSGVMNFVLYLIFLGFGYTDLAIFCFFDFIVVFILMTIYNQKSGAYCLSLWEKAEKAGNAGGGGRADRSGGALLAFLTVSGTAAIGFLIYFFAAKSGLFRIDNAFIGWLKHAFSAKPAPPAESAASPDPVKREPNPLPDSIANQEQNNSPLGDILGGVLKAILWCVVILAAVLLLIAIGTAVIKFYRKLGRNVNENSKSLLFPEKEGAKSKKHFLRRKRDFGIFSRSGNRSVIRRLFWVHIRKHGGKAVRKSDTPFEIGRKIADGSDMERASELYEKARYSDSFCSDADVKDMKRSLKPDRGQSSREAAPGKKKRGRKK